MAFTERIQFIVDAVTGAAEKNLKGLRTELSQAEGFTGKAKAGIGALADTVKNNLGLALAGGASALVAFGVKAVGEFQSLALEADKMAAATGLAVEDASRWIEVAGDLGVQAGVVEGALNRLNRTAASEDLSKYGITAQDANERLIQTLKYLQGVTDETQRAADAQKLLGRSWTELAPLVQSADSLASSLAEVSDAKVIDPDEVEKAKRYRDAMDELNGIMEDLSLTAGQLLVPVLSAVAESLTDIKGAIDDLPSLPSWLGKLLTVSGKDIIAAFPGGSGDMARTPYEILNGLEPGWDVGVVSDATRAPNTTINNNTTVYMPASTDGRDVDRGLQEYWRRNGENG